MDIGPARRIIEVEPVSVPLPIDLPSAEPAHSPEPVESPVEPRPAERSA